MKILIDLRTLKRNPEAGKTTTRVKGLKELRRVSQYNFGGKHYWTEELCTGDGRWVEMRRNVSDREMLPQSCEFAVSQPEEIIDCPPQPAWLYQYLYPITRCMSCGRYLPLNELEGMSLCPCGATLNSQPVDYETPEEAIDRLLGKPQSPAIKLQPKC